MPKKATTAKRPATAPAAAKPGKLAPLKLNSAKAYELYIERFGGGPDRDASPRAVFDTLREPLLAHYGNDEARVWASLTSTASRLVRLGRLTKRAGFKGYAIPAPDKAQPAKAQRPSPPLPRQARTQGHDRRGDDGQAAWLREPVDRLDLGLQMLTMGAALLAAHAGIRSGIPADAFPCACGGSPNILPAQASRSQRR